MADFYDLPGAEGIDGDMKSIFRDVISKAGMTITGERVLPNGHGTQFLTQEGSIPVLYHTGSWDVQGPNGAEWMAKIKGEVPRHEPYRQSNGPRFGETDRLCAGVLMHSGALREEAEALSGCLRKAGLVPLNLQATHQPWSSVLDTVDQHRQTVRFGIAVATPGELGRFGNIFVGLPLLVGLLGLSSVLALVKGDQSSKLRHVPSGMQVLAFEKIDEGTQNAVRNFLFSQADRKLKLRMQDTLNTEQWLNSYSSFPG